jgi:nucleoside triphosphate diphosphatase
MSEELKSLRALLDVMARLRDPKGGCPWDLEQTFATIAPYTIEEAYEVADAIEGAEPERLRDELGDLLFQVVFHARMAEEKGWFDFEGVAEAIASKLIRRHPHVFADQEISDTRELNRQWEDQKERERAQSAKKRGEGASEVLADVPVGLPALTRAAKLGKRAARVGFDWPDVKGVREKVDEELREIDEAVRDAAGASSQPRTNSDSPANPARPPTTRPSSHTQSPDATLASAAPGARIAEELGDALFALVNYARHLHIDPEGALRAANTKFEKRFACMERLARARGLELKSLSASQWDALWNEAKGDLGQ